MGRQGLLLKGILMPLLLEAAKSLISVDLLCSSAISHCSPGSVRAGSVPLWSASGGLALAVVSTFQCRLGVVSSPLVTGGLCCTLNPVLLSVFAFPE